MARSLLLILVLCALTSAGCTRQNETAATVHPDETGRTVQLLLETDAGPIRFEVYPDAAPMTVANFLRYVDEDRFEGASFYRVVRMNNQPDDSIRIEVIQGGLSFSEAETRLPAIEHETTEMTGLLHEDGTISMARSAPGTASSEIFICVGPQPSLDFGGMRNPDGQGFAAFGRVTEGMDVVRAIQAGATDGQMLVERVAIGAARRVE